MKLAYILGSLLLAGVACTSIRTPSDLPTLASLPTGTRDPALPTPTFTASPEPPTATATPPPPCDVQAWWTSVELQIVRFLDVVDVADVTPRSSLSTVILEMQQVYREFQRSEHPDCVAPIYAELVAGMSDMVEGFNDFLGELEVYSNADFMLADAHYWAAVQVLASYNIQPDERLSSGISLLMNASTATWVAQQGASGLVDDHLTQQWIQLETMEARLASTSTAIASS